MMTSGKEVTTSVGEQGTPPRRGKPLIGIQVNAQARVLQYHCRCSSVRERRSLVNSFALVYNRLPLVQAYRPSPYTFLVVNCHSLARFITLPPPPLSIIPFLSNSKKISFPEKKRITPTCVYQPVKFFISWGEDRVAELSEDVELVSGGHTSDTMFSSPLLSLACSSSSVHRGPSS